VPGKLDTPTMLCSLCLGYRHKHSLTDLWFVLSRATLAEQLAACKHPRFKAIVAFFQLKKKKLIRKLRSERTTASPALPFVSL